MTEPPAIPPEILAPPGVDQIVHAIETGEALDAVEFETDTPELVEWAVALVADAYRALHANERLADGWIQKIDEWRDRADALPRRTIAFMKARLEAHALAVRAASVDRKGEPRIKTVSVPSGVIRTRGGSPSIAVTDEAAFIEWAEKNLPDAVKVTKKPLVSELARLSRFWFKEGSVYGQVVIEATGEAVPGVVVEQGRTTASVVPY